MNDIRLESPNRQWDNQGATLTANKVARATAAKRSPGLTITQLRT